MTWVRPQGLVGLCRRKCCVISHPLPVFCVCHRVPCFLLGVGEGGCSVGGLNVGCFLFSSIKESWPEVKTSPPTPQPYFSLSAHNFGNCNCRPRVSISGSSSSPGLLSSLLRPSSSCGSMGESLPASQSTSPASLSPCPLSLVLCQSEQSWPPYLGRVLTSTRSCHESKSNHVFTRNREDKWSRCSAQKKWKHFETSLKKQKHFLI